MVLHLNIGIEKARRVTESLFIEIIGQVKGVYQQLGEPPDWFPWFDSCRSLSLIHLSFVNARVKGMLHLY